jgi:hypothetical protein
MEQSIMNTYVNRNLSDVLDTLSMFAVYLRSLYGLYRVLPAIIDFLGSIADASLHGIPGEQPNTLPMRHRPRQIFASQKQILPVYRHR